jgi:hypothetical protein
MDLKLYTDLQKRLLDDRSISAGDEKTQRLIEYRDRNIGFPTSLTDALKRDLDAYNELIGKKYRLRYYQILALLFTEQFFKDKQAKKLSQNALAYWMATGSGKTLVMHLNVLQYLRQIGNFSRLQIILTTPGVNLIQQHQREFQPFIAALNQQHNHKIDLVIKTTSALLTEDVEYFDLPDDGSCQRLVLVDEAHIGISSAGEGEFKKLRDRLNAKHSFLFEYSATYHNVGNKDIEREYENMIIFDYSYPRFWADGYGKDYWFKQISKDTVLDNEKDNLDENFITLTDKIESYEYFKTLEKQDPKSFRNDSFPDKPLIAFMGNTVENPKEENEELSDITKVIRYLANLSAQDRQRFAPCFNGDIVGNLRITRNKDLSDEILLSFGDGDYWGIVNIGSADSFLNGLEKLELVGIEFRQTSLVDHKFHFKNVDEPNSPINVLIGSRKFAEGWNSYRVSIIGLINLGKSKGNKILQIFGRGVRLRGNGNADGKEGKRRNKTHLDDYKALTNSPEDRLRKLETLTVFSLTKSYLETFVKEISKEIQYVHSFTIRVKPRIFKLENGTTLHFEEYRKQLPIFKLANNEMGFKSVILEGNHLHYQYLDEKNTLQTTTLKDFQIDKLDFRTDTTTHDENIKHNLGQYDTSFSNFLRQKNLTQKILQEAKAAGIQLMARHPNGKYATPSFNDLLPFIGAVHYRFPEGFNWGLLKHEYIIERLKIRIIEEVIPKLRNKVRYDINARNYVFDTSLEQSSTKEKHDFIYEYNITKTFDEKEKLEAFEADLEAQQQRITQLLSFEDIGSHLYKPLLEESHKDILGVKISPDLLNPGEKKFVEDLHFYIQENFSDQNRYAFYLLRNVESLKSIGIYLDDDEGVFYPDFILWTIDHEKKHTHIIFFDPKGERGMSSTKTFGVNQKVRLALKETGSPLDLLEKKLRSQHKKDITLHSFMILRDSSEKGKRMTFEEAQRELLASNVVRLDWHERDEKGQRSQLLEGKSYLDIIFAKIGLI